MKHFQSTVLILFLLAAGTTKAQQFETDFQAANAKSQAEGKPLVLVFSGSDWCKPCIKLKHEVLLHEEFAHFSSENLVLLNLDFPFRKKNRLAPEQQQHNEELADRYNPDGHFPLVLLLNADGSVAHQIDFQPGAGPAPFIAQISSNLPQ